MHRTFFTPEGLVASAVLAAAPLFAQGPQVAAPVEVALVTEEEFTPTSLVLGNTEPKRRSVVAAAIEGYVTEFPIDEGMRVQRGAVLARLRDTVLRLQLKEAVAALEEIRAQHAHASRDLERARQLIETASVTEKDLDERTTRERTLALRVPQQETKVEILKDDITKKVVTAPFDGQIVAEHAELGEWVARGGAVASLVDISSVYVRVNVPERHVQFLSQDQQVEVWVTAASQEPFRGTVASISDEGDPASRTFPVRIEVKREGRLRAGMSAQVEIPAGPRRKALLVPKDAVLLRGTRSFVFVVGEGGVADRRDVRTGASSGSKFAVLEGLQRDERVVVKGNERIQPGAPLRIVAGEDREGD